MMLAVAAAAGWEAGVRILREREQRRNQGKREGREQQDGEQASHGRPDGFQCTASCAGYVLGSFLYVARIRFRVEVVV